MRKIFTLSIGIILLLFIISFPVSASIVNSDNSDNENKPTMIVEYGKGKDAGLVKVTHIHYVKSEAKGRPPKTDTCYKLLGYKWTDKIQYSIQESGFPALSSSIKISASTWDSETNKELFNEVFPLTSGKTWGGVRDYVNLVTYGDYPQEGVIAVTITWYTMGLTKRAVESDILFDTDFNWGTDGNPNVMDLQNIATHEIGHTLGLNDLYTSSCNTVTMYGYSWEGDITKRGLASSDIIGLQKIYGT